MAGQDRHLTRWLVLAALAVCFVLLQRQLWFSTGSLPHGWRLAAQVRQQKRANTALEQINARRREEIKNLQSGTSAVEAHAREDLGLVKKGETFYQIVSVPGTVPSVNKASAPPTATAPRPGTDAQPGGR